MLLPCLQRPFPRGRQEQRVGVHFRGSLPASLHALQSPEAPQAPKQGKDTAHTDTHTHMRKSRRCNSNCVLKLPPQTEGAAPVYIVHLFNAVNTCSICQLLVHWRGDPPASKRQCNGKWQVCRRLLTSHYINLSIMRAREAVGTGVRPSRVVPVLFLMSPAFCSHRLWALCMYPRDDLCADDYD